MLDNLQQVDVGIDNLFLDPNNPRFADLQDKTNLIPTNRICEKTVQDKALSRILDQRFEVKQLKDSIRTIGYLTIDKLVVSRLDDDKYLVIEGNRRLGAIKSLLEDCANGEIELSPEIEKSLRELPVLVLEEVDPLKREHLARVLQGVRHVSGIRPWGPYQQAQIVAIMIDDGRDQPEICEILGLQKKRINILRRCFYALKQMSEDGDYGDEVEPKLFSMYDEIFKVPKFRDWLEWDDEKNLFCNEGRRKMLYGWLVGTEDDNGLRVPAKIVDPKEIRELTSLMDDAIQFKRFCDTPNLRIEEALEGVVTRPPQILWQTFLSQIINVLNQIPASDLQKASDNDKKLLEDAKNLCVNHLKIIDSFGSKIGVA
jgi:hypothetical protein